MIVKTSMFRNEIYLPHAKPAITDSVVDVESKLEDFINIYERDALEKCLGKLSIEFFETLDASSPSLIKTGEDAKWDWLMNGHTYQNKGKDVVWKGIRRTINPLGYVEPIEPEDKIEPNYSFLAEYVYFQYESNNFITRADAGNVKVKSANAYVANSHNKVVGAWRRFIKAVQGSGEYSSSWYKSGFLGGYAVDYRGFETDYDVPLYQFINDMNGIDSDTYPNFNPKIWGELNQMTI